MWVRRHPPGEGGWKEGCVLWIVEGITVFFLKENVGAAQDRVPRSSTQRDISAQKNKSPTTQGLPREWFRLLLTPPCATHVLIW